MTLKEQIKRFRDLYSDSDWAANSHLLEYARGKRAAFSEVLSLLDSQPDTRTLAQEALDKVLAYCAAPEGHDCGEYAFGYLDPDKVKAIIRTSVIPDGLLRGGAQK